ncbi:MAG: hypothetical protein F7B59_01035 [Desulfurococcales archaeon]|nr:hypothetical protein [Desulfurococcales archaeon]
MTDEDKASKKKKRMTLPKKQKDIERVVQEIEEREGGEHHHHHDHGELDEIIAIVELLIDSLNVKMKEVEDKVRLQGNEITRIYKILSILIRYLALDDEEARKELIKEAETILES